MTHKMKLYEPAGSLVNSGVKTIEARLYDEKRQNVNVGDSIIFQRLNGSEIHVKVIGLVICASFEDLYKNVDAIKLGYILVGPDSYMDMYRYYKKEDEELYGVVGIIFEKVDN